MRTGFVKKIAALVVGSMIALAGGAQADDWHSAGWTSTASADVAARTVQRLHDELKSTSEAGDVAGVKATTRELDGVLKALVIRTDDWATRSEVRAGSADANDKNAQLMAELAKMPDGTAKGLPGLDLLSGVTALLTSLLSTLLNLVQALLGGLPVPAPPLPPVPPLPAPPLPAPPLPVPPAPLPVPPLPPAPLPVPPLPPAP
ncbi:hypothetical protein [Actinocrispum wychmicini]|uniref:Uncharacterized protein n=1 Tax=Actinocrispum wychmicini TaxID=1213861 RepID=A0A4R2JYK6_9PSEU|nr:hypothetical protein [Actinocrispum wychmicini]TCO64332.1 hypothetical protein EV192_10199 [Actinocrispum wychmicini]